MYSLRNRWRVVFCVACFSLSLTSQENRDIFVQTPPSSRDPFPNPPVDVIGTTQTRGGAAWRTPHRHAAAIAWENPESDFDASTY